MSLIKKEDSINYIPISIFYSCNVDGKTKEEISSIYKGRKGGAYYLNKFENYLKDEHSMSIKDYVVNYLGEDWPKCPTKETDVGYRFTGKGLIFSKFARGGVNKKVCPSFKKGCEKLSKDRKGEKNPMFGLKPWNKGLDRSDPVVNRIAVAREGVKMSEESKAKMRKARERSPKKARHTTPHTKESKEKMRKATIQRWENGNFTQSRKTGIEAKVEFFLEKFGFTGFSYQVQVGNFIADFACKETRVIIECQGDFFHCNPNSKYSEPIYDVQIRNTKRDKKKREYYKNTGWKLIELWETDINTGDFKDILLCELKK